MKDRIESQILTHYPRSMDDSMSITMQEAWVQRNEDFQVVLPLYFKQIVEAIAMSARASEFVDQSSGVSARMTISTMETLVSNAERRCVVNGDKVVVPRIIDFANAIPGITGKIELVFEGEQEGTQKVARALIGRAIREVFKSYFPDPLARNGGKKKGSESQPSVYAQITGYFDKGNTLTLSDTMTFDGYLTELDKVPGLRHIVSKYMNIHESNRFELASAMEFVLDGLHQNSKIAKDEIDGIVLYKDMVGSIFTRPRGGYSEEEDDESYN